MPTCCRDRRRRSPGPAAASCRSSQPGNGCCAEQERHEHRQEARQQPQPGVAAQREHDRRAGTRSFSPARPRRLTVLLALRWRRPAAGSRIARMVAADEDHERVAQRPLDPKVAARAAIGAEIAAPTTPAERDPAVRLDQGEPRRQQPGHGRGAGHAVRLGGDQAAQRGREERTPTRWRPRRPAASRGTPGTPSSTPIAQRRPWLNRSRNGPISGATIANGSIVRPEEQRHLAARLAPGRRRTACRRARSPPQRHRPR